MKTRLPVLGLAASVLLLTHALAARLGEPAAPLQIKEWVKGTAVDVKDGKNVYVVEFWATWCGPCKASIPHLTELQKKFKEKGVVFVGISDETSDKVKPFVTEMGEKMDYRVALDDERKTTKGYMEAYGQNGIPCAFVVGKDGNVLWVGHPMDKMEQVLQQVLDGKYDLKAAAQKQAYQMQLGEFQALSAKKDPKAAELGKKLVTEAGDDVEALCDLAFSIVASGTESPDYALAEQALDKAQKAAGKETAQIVSIRAIARFESGKQAEGLELVKKAVGLAQDPSEKQRYENYVKVMERKMKAPQQAK